MKTKSLVIALFGAGLLAVASITSCQKESLAPTGTGVHAITGQRIPDSCIPPDSVPSYHRQALDYIQASCDFTGMTDNDVLRTCADATCDFLVSGLHYKKKDVFQYKAASQARLLEIKNMFTPSSLMDSASFAVQAKDLAKATGMSDVLRDRIINFYVKSSDLSLEAEDMDALVEADFDPAAYAGTDQEIVKVFRGVWEDSKAYWNDPSSNYREKGCPYWEYANDAIGGLFGLAFGGVGAIILSAAASAYTHWECN